MTSIETVLSWTTRDGRQVPIAEMSDNHLANTIRFLRRYAEALRWHLAGRYLAGPAPMGDGAQMAYEGELSALADMPDDELLAHAVPQFAALVAEAQRRSLVIGAGQ